MSAPDRRRLVDRDNDTVSIRRQCQLVVSDGIPDPNALVPQEVVVTLKDETVQRWHCAVMLANPARRLTREQHLTKFRRCLDFAREPLRPGTGDTLIDLVDHLEQLADVRELTEPLL